MLNKVFQAGVGSCDDEELPRMDAEHKFGGLEEIVARTVDRTVVNKLDSAGLDNELAPAVFTAANKTPGLVLNDLRQWLEAHGSRIFPMELLTTPLRIDEFLPGDYSV